MWRKTFLPGRGLGPTRFREIRLSQLLLPHCGAVCASRLSVPGGIPRPVSAAGACGNPLPVFLGARVLGSAFCRGRCALRRTQAAARQLEAVMKRTSR